MQNPATLAENLNIYFLSEKAITVEFGHQINESVLQQVSNLNSLVKNSPFPGFQTTVPAYATLTVFFDPVAVMISALPGNDCFEKVTGYLTALNQQSVKSLPADFDTINIPVCYGGKYGPDLDELAVLNHLTVSEVISLHSNAIYKVYMIGFVPGFAYLGGLDPLLAMPRQVTPRKDIPAGSVGIAGQQTGIYPLVTPGGWQLIGQTPLKMFDAAREQPSLLKAGDRVIFKPIEHNEFDQLANT